MKNPNVFRREKNSGEIVAQTAGYIPLRQQIRAFEEAGKRLVEHRCLAYPATVGEETVDRSIFGKRYYDKIDIAELEKANKLKIAELQQYARKEHEKKPKKEAHTGAEKLAQTASEGAANAPQTGADTSASAGGTEGG